MGVRMCCTGRLNMSPVLSELKTLLLLFVNLINKSQKYYLNSHSHKTKHQQQTTRNYNSSHKDTKIINTTKQTMKTIQKFQILQVEI